MGHDSPRAGPIYRHASAEAGRGIADAIEQTVKAARRKAEQAEPKVADEGDVPATKASQ
jgi:hypothetical protein